MAHACLIVHPKLPNADLAIVRVDGNKLIVKATQIIAADDLTVAIGISSLTHMTD